METLPTVWQKVAIGIHGNIMALIMGRYDKRFDLAFWKRTTKPDIYRLTFTGSTLTAVDRLWEK